MRKIAALVLLVTSSCYAEWDVPKVPRRDPCTGRVEDKYVYVMPTCRTAPVPFDFQDVDPNDPVLH